MNEIDQLGQHRPSRPTPKGIRWPKDSDLLAWYERHADETGVSVNRALVRALDYYRAAIEMERGRAEERQTA